MQTEVSLFSSRISTSKNQSVCSRISTSKESVNELRATKAVGCGISANSYWKSRAACNSSYIFLERDPCSRRAT